MLDGSILAVFPLALVREALAHRRAGRYNWEQTSQVGHKIAPVTCKKAHKNTHCGEFPLVFISNVFVDMGLRFNSGRSCYINDRGQHVYPG